VGLVGEVRGRLLTGMVADSFEEDGVHAAVHLVPRRKGDAPVAGGGLLGQWNSPGDVVSLGVGAILSNGGKRCSLRGLVLHGLIERDLVARDG
jgi:hypothetical protein